MNDVGRRDVEAPRLRGRRMALSLAVAAVFVIVIPVSVQDEEGWHLPGFGSHHASTPGPTRTVLTGEVGATATPKSSATGR